ncbi:exported hypothetical protein [Agrobacterium tumefaciens str. B6]|uniref:Uncharacterized protein n=1 Tax=Agrobacterium tumefaciens str. B6 TaxID=1183423 RepID=A0A822V3P8_AGRTU|nr:exported hypothetical protein [Agrobacterium tumefaciens str. B6]
MSAKINDRYVCFLTSLTGGGGGLVACPLFSTFRTPQGLCNRNSCGFSDSLGGAMSASSTAFFRPGSFICAVHLIARRHPQSGL